MSGGPGYWDGLAVAVSADRALIGPPAAALLLHLATLAETKARRNGVYVANQPHLQHVLEVLELVAGRADHAGAGHPDVRGTASLQPSTMRGGPVMTIREASRFLGLSDRQVRRLAEDGRFGPAPLVKGRRQLSRAAVEAAKHHRDNTQEKR